MEAVEGQFADWLKPNEILRAAMRKYLRRSVYNVPKKYFWEC
jgi:hypothetical protein